MDNSDVDTNMQKCSAHMTDYLPLRSKCSQVNTEQDADDQRCRRTGSLFNLQTHACSSLLATNTQPLLTDVCG